MRPGRMRNGVKPVCRSTRGVDRCGLRRRPKPGLSRYARGDVVAAIVVGSARRHGVPFGSSALLASACGPPIRPVLKHGPRSLTCVRVNGRVKP